MQKISRKSTIGLIGDTALKLRLAQQGIQGVRSGVKSKLGGSLPQPKGKLKGLPKLPKLPKLKGSKYL